MKILISNVYSTKNKGDYAIILSMIEHIKKEFPTAEIYISSIDVNDKGAYNEKEFFPNFLSIIKEIYYKDNSLINIIKYGVNINILLLKLNLFKFFAKKGIYVYKLFPALLRKKIRMYEKFDLVIAAGGGYIITKTKKRKIEKFLGIDEIKLFCYDFFLANFFEKPYILYNQSIGPFYDQKDFLNIKSILEKAKIISCREKITYNFLKQHGLSNIILTSDIAFNLPTKMNKSLLQKYDINSNKKNIGITIRKCLETEKQIIFEEEIKKFIINLLKDNEEYKFYFMPQVIYDEWNDNDIHIAIKIKNSLPKKIQERVIIINEDLHPGELKFLYSNMTYFIGNRFHSCIFALSEKVKTLAIAYEPKTEGIMEDLNLNKYVLYAENLTFDKLYESFNLLKNDDEYKKILSNKLEIIKNKSMFKFSEYLY
ncbi:hypothetical protein FE773_01790 [Caminibacter mediatlanticus TB-2]|uniref:Polysaccharide pyruvyl transferase domain-containing protein n=1 Tax=Caminibacter mediatlanticus TB-2 TaxID=391592 RepID=A0ABX5VAS7_9BACT|nr:polysaccharide pyruvyl transferase family protein [Caminibacter mediatlanticus]QCT93954.1 hypothetical protein FE773_01790 [Caminibacter mediatlanticus TB-2]